MEATGFWSDYQPGLRFTREPPGTRAFYQAVEGHRYDLEPSIPEMAQFDRWRGKDVLDAGCGIATDGARFARAGARYTGLDPSPVAVELARRRFELEGLDGAIVEGSATALPFQDESFDLVWSHGVIHHIGATDQAVAEFRRVLRPGGSAVVMLYHRSSFNYAVTIMLVRRLLALSLLVPGAAGVAARITGERPEVLDGHRQLLRRHGLHYLTDRQLFLSNNTDGPGNPLSKVFTRQEAERLFAGWRNVETDVRYLNARLYPGGARFERTGIGALAGRRFGWHLFVRAMT